MNQILKGDLIVIFFNIKKALHGSLHEVEPPIMPPFKDSDINNEDEKLQTITKL